MFVYNVDNQTNHILVRCYNDTSPTMIIGLKCQIICWLSTLMNNKIVFYIFFFYITAQSVDGLINVDSAILPYKQEIDCNLPSIHLSTGTNCPYLSHGNITAWLSKFVSAVSTTRKQWGGKFNSFVSNRLVICKCSHKLYPGE